jgi:hypothetical protein
MGYEITKEKTEQCMATFKESWTVSLQNALILVGGWFFSLLLPVLYLGLGVTIATLIEKLLFHMRGPGILTLVGLLLPGVAIGCLYGGRMHIVLGVVDNAKPKLSYLLLPARTMMQALVVLVICTTAVGLGGMCMILPGAFLYVRLQMAGYYVVDQDMDAISAIKKSWQATGPIFIQLALLDLIFFILSSVSGFTGVGPFIVLIVSEVAAGLVYRKWVMGAEQVPLIEPAE